MSDPVPSSAISDATVGGLSVIVVAGGSTGDVLVKQSDGTYLPATPSVAIGGSVGSTTNRLVKSSGTGGLTVQSTEITVDASDNVSGVGTVGCGAITASGAVGITGITTINAALNLMDPFSRLNLCNGNVKVKYQTTNLFELLNNAENAYANLACGAITASGVIAAASNSAHTFGAIGTQVLLTAGVITCTGSGLTRTLTPSAAGFTSNRGFTCDNGSVVFVQPTGGLMLTSGTGARAGTATLVAGTVTVTNTSVTTNTHIFLTVRTAGGTLGTLSYTLSAGASFTINSSSASDTSTITYFLIEVR